MTPRRRFILYAVAGIAAAFWAGRSILAIVPQSAQNTLSPPPPVIDDDVLALLRKTELHLMQSDFDALEADAARYRNTEDRLAGGYSKLHFYYRALGMYRESQTASGRFNSEIPFGAKEHALHLWKAAKPKSLAVNIAIAQLWSAHAWKTRGREFADNVPPEDMAQYQLEGTQAVTFVKDADPKDDPEIFEVILSSFDAYGGSEQDLYALYNAAIKLFPGYPVYYSRMANFLQTKWYGKPGDLIEYLNGLASSGTDQDLIGLTIATEMIDWEHDSGYIFTACHVAWPTLARAFAIREQKYGTSIRLLNAEMRMAVAAGDRSRARRLALALGDNWDSIVWSGWPGFATARDWALSPN